MKIEKNKMVKIPISIYSTGLHFFCGPVEDLQKAMRADKQPELDVLEIAKNVENCGGLFHEGEYKGANTYYLIWLPKIPVSINDYSNLVHEISHATFSILHDAGLKHSEESDEAYAYLSGYLFAEIDVAVNTLREQKTTH